MRTSSPSPAGEVRLGLRHNLAQFTLLVVVNAFVGAMVGLERSLLPAIAEQEFQLAARTAVLSFIVAFGVAKALTNYGAGTHCVFISFFADGLFSPCDGDNPTTMGEAAVIDNIVLTDADGTRSEDFEDGLLSNGWAFVNLWDTKPFGTWSRLFPHISDNDVCTENRTCAWLWTDHTTPTLANDSVASPTSSAGGSRRGR